MCKANCEPTRAAHILSCVSGGVVSAQPVKVLAEGRGRIRKKKEMMRSERVVKQRLKILDKSMRSQHESIMKHGWGTWASVFWDENERDWRLLRWILKMPDLWFEDMLKLEELQKKAYAK